MDEKNSNGTPMLDIIVPHYKEAWDVGEKFFTMLRLQRGVNFGDFRVTVVNDGEENRLSDGCFSGLPYRVRQIEIPHAGVSAARNAGMDAADAEWIMFCDFDDLFSNVYALRSMMEVLPAKNFDMLWGHMVTEDLLDGRNLIRHTPEKANFVFVHAKLYRRQFLLDNGIRFDTELDFNEDSAFNAIVNIFADYKRIGEIKSFAPPYIWCRRENSVTSTPGRMDASTWGHFRRNLKVCDAYEKHMPYDRLCGMVTRTAYDTFYMINGKELSPEMEEKIMKEFREFWEKNKEHFGKVDGKTLNEIENIAYSELVNPRHPANGTMDTVTKWLKAIDSEGDEA